MGGSGGRRRLGGPLEAERALYSAPSRLSLTQASSYSFPVVRRCPAVTAPPGVPGTPQPGHCASSGPGPHPVLTCCSWEHEEPHRPTHCGEAPLHHRQALTLLIPSLPRAPSWATPSPRLSSPRSSAILHRVSLWGAGSSPSLCTTAVRGQPCSCSPGQHCLLCPTLPTSPGALGGIHCLF